MSLRSPNNNTKKAHAFGGPVAQRPGVPSGGRALSARDALSGVIVGKGQSEINGRAEPGGGRRGAGSLNKGRSVASHPVCDVSERQKRHVRSSRISNEDANSTARSDPHFCSRVRLRQASARVGLAVDPRPRNSHRRPLLHEMRVRCGK